MYALGYMVGQAGPAGRSNCTIYDSTMRDVMSPAALGVRGAGGDAHGERSRACITRTR